MKTLFADLIGHATITRLLSAFLKNPAPAYLFSGAPHLGKRTVAEFFVQALLRTPSEDLPQHPLSHPDVIFLDALEGKKQISVEQVRSLRGRLSLRPMHAPRVVAYLPHADRLHEAGLNALLKVLEEPPAGAVFVLVVEDSSRLPGTVLSRVAHLPFQIVPEREIHDGLLRRGLSEEEASRRARSSRGRPGLAILPPDDPRGQRFIGAFLAAETLGARLRMIEETAKACESSENPEEAWRYALDFSSASPALGNAAGVIFGIALLAAHRLIGSSSSPRLALDAAAVRMSGSFLEEEARLLLPTHLPRTMPLLFENLVY